MGSAFYLMTSIYCYLYLWLAGLKLEAFIEGISLKMAAQDEDEMIRQIFLVFDSQCKWYLYILFVYRGRGLESYAIPH